MIFAGTKMENLLSLQNFSQYEIAEVEEDPFFFSNQLHPLDFSEYSSFNCQWEFPKQESILMEAIPLMESFPTDPLNSSLDIFVPSQNAFQENFYSGWGNDEFRILDEMGVGFEAEKQVVLYNNGDGSTGDDEYILKEKQVKSRRESKSTGSNIELSREIISRYFYMPITQAAKELNVGLTLLKKRCRELGIPRWPYRKLMSLQTLIKNVQEKEMDDGENDSKIREDIELLEEERKLVEEKPEIHLDEKIKKLRQSCFKANYKKRKLVGMLNWQSSLTSPHV